jgi:hypothetical protein
MLNGARANTAATDRSISPQTSTSTMPAAMIAAGAVAWAMLTMLGLVRNAGEADAK